MNLLFALIFIGGVCFASTEENEIVEVSSGGYFTATVTRSGSLWLWGIGSEKGGTRIDGIPSVAQIACGGYRCLVLDHDGVVYEVDALRERYQGFDGKHAMPAVKVALPQRVKKLSTGFNHSIAIAEDGTTVYSWGENVNGKLGALDEHVHAEGDYVAPHAIRFPPSKDPQPAFVDACCAGEFTILLDDAGRVWSFGINTNGHLGREISEETGESATPPKPRAATNGAVYDPIPRLVSQSLGANAYDFRTYPLPRIARVACGGDHTLLLAETGEVYSFGWGGLGQLGHGVFEDARIPTPIALPHLVADESVIEVAVGGYGHSLLLTNQHRVFTFGWNEDHQLGFEHAENLALPTLVKEMEGMSVVSIANNHGFRHSFVVVLEKQDGGGLIQSAESTHFDAESNSKKASERRLIVAIGDNSYGQIEIGHLPKLKQPSDIIGSDRENNDNLSDMAFLG